MKKINLEDYIAIRLDSTAKAGLEKLSDIIGRSMSSIARSLITKYLADNKSKIKGAYIEQRSRNSSAGK